MKLGGGTLPAHPMEAGQRKVTGLVVDFLGECAEYHKIRFHAPVLFGLRPQLGLRGIFLAEGYNIKRNKPILTVPYSGMITTENVTSQPNAPNITLKDIQENIIDDEMKMLSPHFLFGAHVAHQVSLLPRYGSQQEVAVQETLEHLHNKQAGEVTMSSTSAAAMGGQNASGKNDADMTIEEYERKLELFTGGIMPWCRMIDDENWSEEHVLGLYRAALDKWQAQDYTDIFNMYNKNVTHLHTTLKMTCGLEDYRRLTRVIIARVEQVPIEDELCASPTKKRFRRLLRMATKARPPQPSLRMVPMIDMVNHSNRANTLVRMLPDGSELGVPGPCASLWALNDIEGGKELCRYYNFAMSRGNALFRYGFLPFEMMSLEHFDPWKEHYARGVAPNLMPESAEDAQKREEIEREVQRLQATFRQSKK